MSNEKTVSLNGFKEADQVVFSSLLSLLSFKTNSDWKIVDNEDYDIAIVDVDSDKGEKAATQLESQGKKVIFFGTNALAKNHDLRLTKPLRANEILNCLNQLSSQNTPQASTQTKQQSNQHSNQHMGVRLTKWPQRHILNSFPGSSKLCAVLMRHTISLEKASTVAGLPMTSVQKFVDMCKESGCIQEHYLDLTHDQSDHKPRKHGLLFSKLRLKFDSRA